MSTSHDAHPDLHGHDHLPEPRTGSVGIPRSGDFDPVAFERAIGDLLRACGIAPDNAHTGRTAQRVRERIRNSVYSSRFEIFLQQQNAATRVGRQHRKAHTMGHRAGGKGAHVTVHQIR